MRLFVDADDNVVRGDMIRALNFAGMDRDDYLSFLLHVCSTRREPVVLVAAIDALSAFRHHRSVFDTLLALTSHDSEMVKVATWNKLVRSRHLEEARDVIAEKLSASASPLVRQAIARGLAPSVGTYGQTIMAYEPFAKKIGFRDVLGTSDFLDVAYNVSKGRKDIVTQVRSEAQMIAEGLADLGVPIRIGGVSGNVYIEPRPKGHHEGGVIDDYVVEDHSDYILATTRTQAEAIIWAKKNGFHPLVARVRHLNDKAKPDHWRST